MKKTILFIGLIILIAAIGFYVFIYGDKTTEPAETEITQEDEEVIEEVRIELLEWLKGGQGVECVVTSPEGDIIVKTRDDKIRVEGIVYAAPGSEEEVPGVSLTDGDWVYIWSGNEGTKFNIKTLEELSKATSSSIAEYQEDLDDYSWEQMVNDWQEQDLDYQCEEVRLSDDEFIPPSEVNFVDWTETMERLQQLQEELQLELGEGEVINQEDIEKYLEEMGLDETLQDVETQENTKTQLQPEE